MYGLLISGMPASGKSTIAMKLSAELKIPMFSKDDYKELLFDNIGFKSRAEKNKLGFAAMDILYYSAEQLMKQKQPFILENNFEDCSFEGLEKILNRYNYTVITIRLTGEPIKIYERFLARDQSENRHRGHVVNTQYPEDQSNGEEYNSKTLEQFLEDIDKRGYNRFVGNGPLIEIDVTNISDIDFESILIRIKKSINLLENAELGE